MINIRLKLFFFPGTIFPPHIAIYYQGADDGSADRQLIFERQGEAIYEYQGIKKGADSRAQQKPAQPDIG